MSRSYVFQLNTNTWTVFDGLDIEQAEIQSAGSILENYNLILDSSSNFQKYPGTSYTSQDAIVETKEFFLNEAVLRRVKVDITGTGTLETNVRQSDYPGGVKTDSQAISNNTWQWVANAKARGRSCWIKLTGPERVKSILLEYKVK